MKKHLIVIGIILVLLIVGLSGCNEKISNERKPPIINSFTATPVVISLGKATVLNWSVENATSISINNGIGNVSLNGPYTVVPTQNQTYILTAFNSYGRSNATVYISVINEQTPDEGKAPIINFFKVTPSMIFIGTNTSVLNWSVTGATNISINNGVGNVASNGSYRVAPTKYLSYYNLTASNAYGTNTSTVIVLVRGATPDRIVKTISAINTATNVTGNSTTYKVISADDGILWANISVSWAGGGGPFGVNLTAISTGITIAAGDYFTIIFGANGTYSADIIYNGDIIWAAQTITV